MGSLDGEEGGFRRRLQIFVFFFAVCRCGGILLQCATAQTSKKLIFDWLFVRKSNKYLRICFLPCRRRVQDCGGLCLGPVFGKQPADQSPARMTTTASV